MENPIKEIRESLNMTRSEFAKATGLNTVQYVHNLESGKHNVGLNVLEKIVTSLNKNNRLAILSVSINVEGKDILIK